MPKNYFGMVLANLRRSRNLRQWQLAGMTSLDASYLAALEGGRRKPPRETVLARLLEALRATDQEAHELRRSATLSTIARSIRPHAGEFAAVDVALKLLEYSHLLATAEIQSLEVLVDSFAYRARLPSGLVSSGSANVARDRTSLGQAA